MTATEPLTAGSPCPAGCMQGWPRRKEPERLRANEDGELSCRGCWDVFGFAPAAAGREISTSAAIALAQASSRQAAAGGRDRLAPGCRFAGTLRPGDTYWFTGRAVGDDGQYMTMEVHRVTVVRGPRLDTTSDIFGRDLIRFWIWDPATGNEGSATFGPRGVVRVDLDSQYWVPAPGTLDPAAQAALPHHPRCECGTCRADLAVAHHPDCQCVTCQPGKWAW